MNHQTDNKNLYQHHWCNRVFILDEDWGEQYLSSLCCLFLCNIAPWDCPVSKIETELTDEVDEETIAESE